MMLLGLHLFLISCFSVIMGNWEQPTERFSLSHSPFCARGLGQVCREESECKAQDLSSALLTRE